MRFGSLGVRTNADTPEDAKNARQFGAEGIGLCRTEHMFFGTGIDAVREMILADETVEREGSVGETTSASTLRLYRDL